MSTELGVRPLWASVPRDLAARFRPAVGALTRDMITEIQESVPAYARPLDGSFGAIMTAAVEQSVLRVLDMIGTGSALEDSWGDLFRQLGRAEFRAGRNLDSLQTAYRIGGRVAWRHVAAWAEANHLPVPLFSVLAEGIFAYVEEISSQSVAGYTQAQAQSTQVLDRHRKRLVETLLTDPSVTRSGLSRLAALARWPVPKRVAVVALDPMPDDLEAPRPAPHDDVLADLDGDTPCLIVADPKRHMRRLESELDGRVACVGPAVALSAAATSLSLARRAVSLVRRGIIPAEPVVWCQDHLPTLWLFADEFLLSEVLARNLAPMAGLTAKQQDRIATTMLTWLHSTGGAPDIAERLGIHPQTVRYRMRQVDKLFGAQLRDPHARLELEIALRARQMLTPTTASA
ncbi:PucR family transcriptional regulator [Amycolatopsis suaedae]|uniref:PucR family transcriptional regulator n=1 Tax=Amycolatopsis suaedae TaxID=2510978 RepID=A0A4Q7JD52_9PSEU|nr:helix-turn-helix domain-containing protein [Amycolatopsis suaedae]RZQ65820.1 PucR family transcriptional regulator [Amycolatopsis suaedae]